MEINIRRITEHDNKEVAAVIRCVMEEHDVARPGTIYYDSTLDKMYEQYQHEGAVYFVAELDGNVQGGCGINTLAQAGDEYCELQRMFLMPALRGTGTAQLLMDKCLEFAKANHYSYCYLETINEFQQAIKLYKKNGFEFIYSALGNTGHFSCEIRMVKPLTD